MSDIQEKITSPDDPAVDQLCQQLAELAPTLDAADAWPGEQLQLCARYGVFEWFLPTKWGGQGWSDASIIRGYLALSQACLTTTFVITQRTGACRRIAASDNDHVKKSLLPDLISGKTFATVGISHLTTSRRHLAQPVLRATAHAAGVTLDGYSPWVTGAAYADTVVIGATFEDKLQLLAALPTRLPGVSVPTPQQLVGLTASQTGPVYCQQVEVPTELLLAGPAADVMKQGFGAKTGGLQTSTLAIGLASAAIGFLEGETDLRQELSQPTHSLRQECDALREDLLAAADGHAVRSNEQLRTRANSLALRSTQAALAAAKGSGYVVGHPAGRWCREALFFLVWSCPQPVMAANLCELAGISD